MFFFNASLELEQVKCALLLFSFSSAAPTTTRSDTKAMATTTIRLVTMRVKS